MHGGRSTAPDNICATHGPGGERRRWARSLGADAGPGLWAQTLGPVGRGLWAGLGAQHPLGPGRRERRLEPRTRHCFWHARPPCLPARRGRGLWGHPDASQASHGPRPLGSALARPVLVPWRAWRLKPRPCLLPPPPARKMRQQGAHLRPPPAPHQLLNLTSLLRALSALLVPGLARGLMHTGRINNTVCTSERHRCTQEGRDVSRWYGGRCGGGGGIREVGCRTSASESGTPSRAEASSRSECDSAPSSSASRTCAAKHGPRASPDPHRHRTLRRVDSLRRASTLRRDYGRTCKYALSAAGGGARRALRQARCGCTRDTPRAGLCSP